MKKFFYEKLIKYFVWKNYLGHSTGDNCLGGNYLNGKNPTAIIRGTIIQAPFGRGYLFWGPFSKGEIIQGTIVRVAKILGQLFERQLS